MSELSPYGTPLRSGLNRELGTGYFGCRDRNGNFDELQFKDLATRDEVKMTEIKLSQGAKPGHGGLCPLPR